MFSVEREGELARLVLDRGQARNAIPLEGWPRLAELIAEIADSPTNLLVVTGAGGVFCAGADLGDFARLRDDEVARTAFRVDMRRALESVRTLEIPVVAWIEGPCYGAGVALAMACDLRIAAPSASFAITPAKIGISYPQQDVHRLVELVGTGQAARLLFTAGRIDSAEAHRIGLVDEIAQDVAAILGTIAANDDESLKVLKRSLRRAAEGVRQDDDLDRRFDELVAGEALARRLEALRRK